MVHLLGRTVERVYLTDGGGIPLAHLSRSASAPEDPETIASMFTAIQSFMNDSFHVMGVGGVRSIEMGRRHHVAFGRGRWVLLYVVYSGRESNRLERRVEHVVQDLESQFAPLLESWRGDVDRASPVRDRLVEEFGLSPTVARPPGSR